MVLNNGNEDSNNFPEPSVNVQVFGDGSIGDAFGGAVSSLLGGFTSFMRKIINTQTSMQAMTNLVAVVIIIATIIMAWRYTRSADVK